MEQYRNNYLYWKNNNSLTDEERAELEAIEGNDEEQKQRFSRLLSFGTAGLRGTMKLGMNAMNTRTVALATQGLAALLKSKGRNGICIAYDSRNNSLLFSKTAASVLAANGIKVYIFDGVRPTPELSFALRRLGCAAGINITASHNPKEYNGYKAYWDDGAQLSPEHADIVSTEIAKLDIFTDIKTTDYDKAVDDGIITVIGSAMDEEYYAAVLGESINDNIIPDMADRLKIVYSPLNGAGYKAVPEILRRRGLNQLYIVKEQSMPDGNFPTTPKPNPEVPAALKLGCDLADKMGSDLVMATDPDADRVGIAVRRGDRSFVNFTGNQTGALLLDYIITALIETGKMPEKPYAVKSIVSTALADKICHANGVKMYNVLTGFKFIGEAIKLHEEANDGEHFLFGFEESCGYLKGTYARDKDAVVASMLICEMAAYYLSKGMTLYDALVGLYNKYGFSLESSEEVYLKGNDVAAQMTAMLNSLRKNPPKRFGNADVEAVGDYLSGYFTDNNGTMTATGQPRSDVLFYKLVGGDSIIVRPSGTEPKVKLYYLLSGEDKDEAEHKLGEYRKTVSSYIG